MSPLCTTRVWTFLRAKLFISIGLLHFLYITSSDCKSCACFSNIKRSLWWLSDFYFDVQILILFIKLYKAPIPIFNYNTPDKGFNAYNSTTMSTVINTIPNQASYSKRQRYEFEIFDKSIKEIENLFKQDINIHPIKKQRLESKQTTPDSTKINIAQSHDSNQNNYTHQNERLDGYLRKDQKSDSYKSLFSINQHQHHQQQQQDHHQLHSFQNKPAAMSKKIPMVHPSIINHIRLETGKKIDYYVNDISRFTLEDSSKQELIYNSDGLYLQNDQIITNLINIIDSNK